MKYPEIAQELVNLLEQDQLEVREHSKLYKILKNAPEVEQSRKRLTQRTAERVQKMLEVLQQIEMPTISHIGIEGSEALAVLAVHAKYTAMKQILQAFEAAYQRDPEDVYREMIPAMKDRVRMLEGKKQIFGTQWLLNEDDTFFLYPVDNFKLMNERRAAYGLDVSRRPRDMTFGIPDGPPPPEATESDQRQPTKEEYRHQLSESLD